MKTVDDLKQEYLDAIDVLTTVANSAVYTTDTWCTSEADVERVRDTYSRWQKAREKEDS